MNINFRGHKMNEEDVKKALEEEINFYKKILNPEKALDVIFKKPFYVHDSSCLTCGESQKFQTKNGKTFETTNECSFNFTLINKMVFN
jgi:hypothetical protein